MPYGYGSSNKGSSSSGGGGSRSYGPPGSSSRRSAPTHQPRSRPAPTVTTGGPPSILNPPPVIPKGRTTPGGITGINSTALLRAILKARYRPKPRGLSSNVRMTYHGSPYYNTIMNQRRFTGGIPTGGFRTKLADLFQSGAKTLSSPSKNIASMYGKTIPIVSSVENLALPTGVSPGKTPLEALKNIGKSRFGTEVIQTPAQATKGMELASKLGTKYTGPTAQRLLQTGTTAVKPLAKTLARLAPGAGAVLGGASALKH